MKIYIPQGFASEKQSCVFLNHSLVSKKIMASFSIEEFVGNGILKELLPKLLEEGWDDVPTLKIMNVEDMDAINMTREQKVSYILNQPSPIFLFSTEAH